MTYREERYITALCWYTPPSAFGAAQTTVDAESRRNGTMASAEYAYEEAMRTDLSPRMRIASAEGHRRCVLRAGLTHMEETE